MTFNPSRLALARRRRGLTKSALATAADVSIRTLIGYESGLQDPTEATLVCLAGALRFPLEFFSRPDAEEPPLGASFRAFTKMTATQRSQALAAGALALDLADWIEERFELPEPSVPRYRGVDPETAADSVRNEWGIGERPISNVIHLLESHGVRVFSLAEESRELDAFSFWRRHIPYIFLNTMKSAEHSRMDASHELGHLTLHGFDDVPRGRAEEREASQFGAAFLMPARSVIAEAPRGGRMGDLIAAKRRWRVSLAALAHRMRQVNLLSEWQYRSVFIEISSRGYRTTEPNGIAAESSQVLAKVFRSLRDDGYTRSQLARELAIPLQELNKLIFGLVLTGLDGKGGGGSRTTKTRPALELLA